MMKRKLWLIPIALLLGSCSGADTTLSVQEAEVIVKEFYGLISSYDFEGMRVAVTADFEMIEAGQRMDVEGFIDFLGGLQARGVHLDFNTTEFRTEVVGDVAYTSNRMQSASGSRYLEATILRRTDQGWLVDRVFSTPARGGN